MITVSKKTIMNAGFSECPECEKLHHQVRLAFDKESGGPDAKHGVPLFPLMFRGRMMYIVGCYTHARALADFIKG